MAAAKVVEKTVVAKAAEKAAEKTVAAKPKAAEKAADLPVYIAPTAGRKTLLILLKAMSSTDIAPLSRHETAPHFLPLASMDDAVI